MYLLGLESFDILTHESLNESAPAFIFNTYLFIPIPFEIFL